MSGNGLLLAGAVALGAFMWSQSGATDDQTFTADAPAPDIKKVMDSEVEVPAEPKTEIERPSAYVSKYDDCNSHDHFADLERGAMHLAESGVCTAETASYRPTCTDSGGWKFSTSEELYCAIHRGDLTRDSMVCGDTVSNHLIKDCEYRQDNPRPGWDGN